MKKRNWIWRWVRRGLIASALVLAVLLVPVVWVEARCYAETTTPDTFRSRLTPQFQREEVNSYLTYPEWSIVHAYEDLAAASRRTSESDFSYGSHILGYWTSLCDIIGYASARGTVSGEYRALLHIIGVSFTAEMAVKGAYERTIGRATVWLRGTEKTHEDLFAAKVAEEYAGFLHQTPWYEFPFAARLGTFWRETPFRDGNLVRRVERRVALTLEYGAKSLYAQVLGAMAGAAPAPLAIRSVVTGGDPDGVDGVRVVERLGNGATIIETPRYAAFTQVMQALARTGISFTEIAGNDDIMVGVLVPPGRQIEPGDAVELFSLPTGLHQGWHRHMMSVPVPRLTNFITRVGRTGAKIEHVYDY